MAIETVIITKIVEEIFKYLLDATKDKYKNRVSQALFGDEKKKAFERALKAAVEELETKHREWVEALFDASFLGHEGAPVLAGFMVRDGEPDPSELAKLWADSLRLKVEQRTTHIRELEPVTADFFRSLSKALKAEPELAELHDSRALEQIAANTEIISQTLGTEKATPGTRYDYLRWIIDRNLYLDPRGIEQTQRQVQLKLNEIYVSLSAQREETPGAVDKRLLEKEMAELELKLTRVGITAEEAEDRREQLLAHHYGRHISAGNIGTEVLELHEVVSSHNRLVILGDPGSGKTTLLRYLALMHAEALYYGRSEASKELGLARFPVILRIAAYAESGNWKERPLSDFLAEYCMANECPKSGTADLILTELEKGNCLVLLDGLDEIVSADDRRGIVQKIESFINRYDNVSNRFIVTSRIAGYRNAPLADPSLHYTVQDMDDNQIKRFLNNWCPAVEDAQTPELSSEIRTANAKREIDGILNAVETSPGVRRLATNPLLLTILALIHRTGARLPEKRIQLYKLAADTLARTWRAAHGVPESALIEETYLTRLLSKMAYWLHVNKPTGIATEQEVYDVLGEEWARIKNLEWNPDEPNPAIISEVEKFLTTVRVQTGLFVERAPKRYGFMHLTFEEYYVARYLVRRPKTAAKLIRQHLHDPRWEEPILLALGFKGMDYPDEASELLEAAILAQGEDAEDLVFKPSEYEDILGRDYLFALRCLGDQIPAHPQLIKALIERMVRELIYREGAGRFQRYHTNLLHRLASLRGSDAELLIVPRILDGLRAPDAKVRYEAMGCFESLRNSSSNILEALILSLKDEDKSIRVQAVNTLGQLEQATPEVIEALIPLLKDKDQDVRRVAVWGLGQLGASSYEVIEALIPLLKDKDPNVRTRAILSLGQLGKEQPEVIEALVSLLKDEDAEIRRGAAFSLRQLEQATPEVIEALISLLKDEDKDVRISASDSLVQLRESPPEVIEALVSLLKDKDQDVRRSATSRLRQLEQATPEVIEALIPLLKDKDKGIRNSVISSLGYLGQFQQEAIKALILLIKDEDAEIRRGAAFSLGQLEQATPEVIEALIPLLKDKDQDVRRVAARSLGQLGKEQPEVIEALVSLLKDEDKDVRISASDSLVQLRESPSEVIEALIPLLKDEDQDVRSIAIWGLIELKQVRPEVIEAIPLIKDEDENESDEILVSIVELDHLLPQFVSKYEELLKSNEPLVRSLTARILGNSGIINPQVLSELRNSVSIFDYWELRRSHIEFLGRVSHADNSTIKVLFNGLIDNDNDVRKASGEALANLGRRFPDKSKLIASQLMQAINAPMFEQTDNIENRTGQDYAFDALWLLVIGEEDADREEIPF